MVKKKQPNPSNFISSIIGIIIIVIIIKIPVLYRLNPI